MFKYAKTRNGMFTVSFHRQVENFIAKDGTFATRDIIVAKLYEISDKVLKYAGETAAILNPADQFSFEQGARVALARITESFDKSDRKAFAPWFDTLLKMQQKK